MPSSVSLVLKSVLDEYALLPDGIHAVVHWARVFENSLRLADETGANVEVRVKVEWKERDGFVRTWDFSPG